MELFRIKGVHIEGVCACLPERRVENRQALEEMYGPEAEKIVKSTGIEVRYLAKEGTSTGDLCLAAAKHLLAGTGTKPEEIGAVVFVSFTQDRLMPFNASMIQNQLGLSKEIPAFDLSLACSGYGYGLYMAALLAKAGGKKTLLLDGDIQSAYMSGEDKATVPVLADAGSATLLSADSSENEWAFAFYTDGSGREALMIPAGGSAAPLRAEQLEIREREDGSRRRDVDIYMDGFGIYRFVAQDVSRWLSSFLEELGEDSTSIDFFVPHQANMYMIKQLARKLKFNWENTWQSGDRVGNSASATVPVTIAMNAARQLKKDRESRILLSGFGGGLSASAGLVTLNPDAFYELFQYEGRKN